MLQSESLLHKCVVNMSLDMIKVRSSKESDPTLFIIEISYLLGFGLTDFYYCQCNLHRIDVSYLSYSGNRLCTLNKL